MKSKTKNKKPLTKIIGIGKIDLNFCLELNENDENDLNMTIDSIDTLEKLKFLQERPEYKSRITLSSNSYLITTLLYLNKVSKNKNFIEFSGLAPFSYSEQEKFLKPILTEVVEHNFLFVVENDILPFYKTTVNFYVKKGTQIISTFNLCLNDNIETFKDDSQVQDKNQEEKTLSEKLRCDFKTFNYVCIDLNEFVDLSYLSISFSDVLNLITTVDKNFKDVSFCLFFPSIMSNINQLNIEALHQLGEILSFSDYVFFEKKEAMAFWNLLSQLNSTSFSNTNSSFNIGAKSKTQFKLIVERNFHMTPFRRKWYKRSIKFDRVGIFLDELNHVTLMESHKDNFEKCTSKEFAINIIPKANSANKKLVQEYKKQYDNNRNFLNAVFMGGFLSKLLNNGGYDYSIFFGTEITKRCLDIFKLELEFPLEPEFYLVSNNSSGSLNYIEKKNKQERGFVLDCTNVVNSKLNDYNPLFDNNLTSFFNSNVVRKHLNDMGFINSKGFILLDTKKKNTLLLEKSAEKVLKKDKNIMIAIKENSNKMNHENLERTLHYKSKQLNDPSIVQLEMLAHTLSYSPLKNKQLPSYSESNYFYKPINLGKTKLNPLNKDYNKTTQNLSYNKVDTEERESNFYYLEFLKSSYIKDKFDEEEYEKEEKQRMKLELDEIERQNKRIEEEKLEQERLEKEKLEKDRLEKERLEKEKLELEKKEQKRKEKEEKERIEREKKEKEKEKADKEKAEKEKAEKERLALEKIKEEEEEKKKELEEHKKRQVAHVNNVVNEDLYDENDQINEDNENNENKEN